MPNPIKVCLVGAGRVAKVHANSLSAHVPGAELAAIVDPVPDALQTTAEQFGIQHRFTTLAEALQ
ncbi:MAG: Gfo/Idh/MocA family oxidoreductase, partial [Anaerolineales bacterium]